MYWFDGSSTIAKIGAILDFGRFGAFVFIVSRVDISRFMALMSSEKSMHL